MAVKIDDMELPTSCNECRFCMPAPFGENRVSCLALDYLNEFKMTDENMFKRFDICPLSEVCN